MSKEREKAHRELQHALAAMTEVTGDASHGPAALCIPLLKRSAAAGVALFNAAKQLDTLGIKEKPHALPALQKLAPVLLDVVLDSFEPVLAADSVKNAMRQILYGDNKAPMRCDGCRLPLGTRFPSEPTVRMRPDGKARCNGCEAARARTTRLFP